MAAIDAQFYWMSAKVPNDDCLLYAFDREPADLDGAVAQLLARARACPGLSERVSDDCALRYPRWVPASVGLEQVVRHHPVDFGGDWDGCLSVVVDLADDQLDLRRMPWRLHVFTPVHGIPGASGPGTVVVLQVPHALADGRRAGELAAWLFGRPTPVPVVAAPRAGRMPWLAIQAARGHRQLVRDIEAGSLPPPLGSRPALATNNRTGAVSVIRTLVRRRAELSGPTVTVGVLAAISTALSELLGGDVESLGAEVPMAKPGARLAYNHFGNAAVGLYPELGLVDRMQQIATDLDNGRRRFEHPASRASDLASAAVPAAMLRWGVSQFDADARLDQVSGNTVVSSVHRGAADLTFGGAPVLLTTGYPALSAVVGLTHGVHGIGDMIAISVRAAESAVPDVDAYVRLLDAAL